MPFVSLVLALTAMSVAVASAATLPPGFNESTVASGLDQPTLLSIAPDGRERMDGYATRYLGIFGERAARSLARLCTTTSATALRDAGRRMADAGADDFLLVPTTSDPDEVHRLADVLGA